MGSSSTTVGIADMKITRNEGVLTTYALGSCIGICLYDPVIKLAGMVHIMLPHSTDSKDSIFKYANTGISETIRKMEVFGAVKRRLVAKIAGGAKMFNIPGDNDFGNIGKRNIDAVITKLRGEGIPIKSQDVGGEIARTMIIYAENGEVTVKTFGRADKKL